MKRAELKDPGITLESLLKAAEQETIVLTENGKVRFLVEPADEFDVGDLQIVQNSDFQQSIQRAREQWERGEHVCHEDVVKKYGAEKNEGEGQRDD